MTEKNKTVEQYLKEVDYDKLNKEYVPSEFALNYMNFVKMVNAGKEDIQTSPMFHYKMADSLNTKRAKVANLCLRGAGKALEISTPIITPNGFKPIGELDIGDEVYDRNGKKTYVTATSQIFTNQCYEIELEDGTKFIVNEDHINIVHKVSADRKIGNYWKEFELTVPEILERGLFINRKISDRNPTGKEFKWFIPLISEAIEFEKSNYPIDSYTLGVIIGDGSIRGNHSVSITTHVDDYQHYIDNIPYETGKQQIDNRNPNVCSFNLLKIARQIEDVYGVHKSYSKYIPKEILFGSKEERLALLQGLMDTDGTIDSRGNMSFNTVNEELAKQVQWLIKSLGGYAHYKFKPNQYEGSYNVYFSLWNVCPFRLQRKVDRWRPTEKYKRGKRVAITNIKPITDRIVESKCIAVASETKSYLLDNVCVTHNTVIMGEMLVLYLAVFNKLPYLGTCNVIMYVADSMENGAKSLRTNIEARYNHSEFLQKYIPEAKFTDTELTFKNIEGKETYVRLFGASSGVRGFKRNGDRPVLAILDDLISDEMANSQLQLEKVYDLIYKAVDNALNPKRNKIIFSGTPFNKKDPLYHAIESGAWEVNVYPVCEQFPCKREEFRGAWEERFGYDEINKKYQDYIKLGRMKAFNQELMLRISSDEDRVIQDDDISWFNIEELIKNKQKYNFYITTDFATSTNRKADMTVIGVWAVDVNQNRYLVDGSCGRYLMNDTFNKIFEFVKKYEPMSVGIEVTGQQGGFVPLLKDEMLKRNVWFTIAKGRGSNKEGIAVRTNKMDRFRLTEPFFKRKKIHLPKELKNSTFIQEILAELETVTIDGIKAVHDDAIDMISQLDQMVIIYPSEYQSKLENQVPQELEYNPYEDFNGYDDSNLTHYNSSYLV